MAEDRDRDDAIQQLRAIAARMRKRALDLPEDYQFDEASHDARELCDLANWIEQRGTA